MNQYTTALIDIDGVINHAVRFSERYTVEYGVDMSRLLPFFDGPFQDCLLGKSDLKEVLPPYLKDWGWAGSFDELLDFWLAGEVNPDKEIVKVITNLHQKGIRCIGASNQEKYRMAFLRAALHLEDYMDVSFSSADIGLMKPDPDFFNTILSKLGCKPDEVVFWDDDLKNVLSAQNLGIRSYQFTNKQNFMRQVVEAFPLLRQD